jgi:ZIP family zinc transporter
VATAALTLVGWAITVVRTDWSPRTAATMLLLAAAAMVAVSVGELLPEAAQAGLGRAGLLGWTGLGVAVVLLVRVSERLVHPSGGDLQSTAVIIATALTLHKIPEGAAPYTAALSSVQGGLVAAAALGLHNVAEGVAISSPVIADGGSRRTAFWLTLAATVGAIAGAAVAYAATAVLDDHLVAAMSATVAGVMIGVSVLELLPAALERLRSA